MRASFIHVADMHLGYEQYGVRERFNDFSRAFWDIMQEALHRQVDFVVIAGDLFNKRAIDAQMPPIFHGAASDRRSRAAITPRINLERDFAIVDYVKSMIDRI